MKTWIITDTHFGHEKLTEIGERERDFSKKICLHWEKFIGKGDMVIHLGDVYWSDRPLWSARLMDLPGRKILVAGNHDDDKSYSWLMANGFDFACHTFSWRMYGYSIVFSHKPLETFSEDINIHGHLHLGKHRELNLTKRHLLVSLENNGLKPLPLKTILANSNFL
jgi:calcineurin-like phosphoesterase family protein